MKSRIAAPVAAAVFAFALAGCENLTRQEKGAVAGAVVGGVVGNAATKSTGGTVVGGVVGGVIGHEVAK